MRKRDTHILTCKRKHRHDNYSTAKMEADRLERKTGDRFNVYHCEWCYGFHVGHHNRNDKETTGYAASKRVG